MKESEVAVAATAAAEPTSNELALYESLKQELLKELRKGKVFRDKGPGSHAGLINQGATCYLNSLLQALFFNFSFRKFIVENECKGKITSALRQLFVQLLLTEDVSVSTKSLTTAFGWTNSEVFEQHDVQELFTNMTDALCKESVDFENFFNKHFMGNFTEKLECPMCKNQLTIQNKSHDIPLAVPELTCANDHNYVTLQQLLQGYIAVEVLDKDNMWRCSKCNESVQAKKSTTIDKLPQTLFLHVKRLSYDTALQRKKKITTPVYFPSVLNSSELNPDLEKQTYLLHSVLLHSGTASGGHYRTLININGNWFEFDDSNVIPLADTDIAAQLWYNNQSKELSNSLANSNNIYESVYMLGYKLQNNDDENEITIPQDIQTEVAMQNQHYLSLKKAYEIHKLMTEIVCFKVSASNSIQAKTQKMSHQTITLHLPSTMSFSKVCDSLYSQFIVCGEINTDTDMSRCRLRKFNSLTRLLGETFVGKEDFTLSALGLHPACTLALEILSPGEKFADFNPNELQLKLKVSTDEDSTDDEDQDEHFIRIDGVDATVETLRQKAAIELNSSADQIVLIKSDNKSYIALSKDDKVLVSDYFVQNGDEIIAYVLRPGKNYHDHEFEILQKLRESKNMIKVQFNSLCADEKLTEYDHVVSIAGDSTLGELKSKIAEKLSLSMIDFHLRRSAGSPQLKAMNKSLNSIGFVDQCIVHVQVGKENAIGEHILRCELEMQNTHENESPSLVELKDIVVRGNMSVLHLKEHVFSSWDSLISGNSLARPLSPNHIRIRDGKVGMSSNPLRNDRILSKCLLGLSDGRKIILQILPEEEILGPDSLFIFITVISFQSKVIHRPHGLSIPRNTTVRQLYQLVLEKFSFLREEYPPTDPEVVETQMKYTSKFPECGVIHCAKGLSTGPAMTIKTALQLKWNDESILMNCDNSIDQSPLNLRDGSVIVVRNCADFERAREDARARIAARPSSSAGDSPARGRMRPGSRSKSRGGLREKEKGIKINLENPQDAPPPPNPSPDKDTLTSLTLTENIRFVSNTFDQDQTDQGLPNAPVRVVKVLRSPRTNEVETL